jgi:hypothetical protein
MVVVVISKLRLGYVFCLSVNGRSYTRELGSDHPETAAEAAIAAWKDYHRFPKGVRLNLPPEVIQAVVGIYGRVPWS